MSNTSKPKFWTPFRLVATVIVLSLVALFGATSCNSNDQPPAASPQSGKPAPAGLTILPPVVSQTELRTVNGSELRLSDFKGKVLFVNLWATWCGPCQAEIPELVALHKEFQQRGVEMIGLSTENPDASAERVKEFIKAFNMDYHVGWAPGEVALALMQDRNSIPQSFVITRDGKILRRFIGFSPRIVPELRKALEEALQYGG